MEQNVPHILVPTTIKSNDYFKKIQAKLIMNDLNQKEKNNSITYYFILTTIVLIILFIEAIYILISGIKKGFIKKEILTQKSDIGFDIIIKN